ncbi:MAG: hypothetical protein V3V50_09040 [Gammaproteobacteria bacterium]
MSQIMHDIERYLLSCRELNVFCSQNGWIDKESLFYEVIEQDDHQIIVLVQFNEILMEGSGSSLGRVPCHGRLRLLLDRYGQIKQAELL